MYIQIQALFQTRGRKKLSVFRICLLIATWCFGTAWPHLNFFFFNSALWLYTHYCFPFQSHFAPCNWTLPHTHESPIYLWVQWSPELQFCSPQQNEGAAWSKWTIEIQTFSVRLTFGADPVISAFWGRSSRSGRSVFQEMIHWRTKSDVEEHVVHWSF